MSVLSFHNADTWIFFSARVNQPFIRNAEESPVLLAKICFVRSREFNQK